MTKKPRGEFQKQRSEMAKLEHRLKVEEEKRMVFRRMKQEEKK